MLLWLNRINSGIVLNLVLSPELLQFPFFTSKLSLSALAALLSAAQLQALLRVAF